MNLLRAGSNSPTQIKNGKSVALYCVFETKCIKTAVKSGKYASLRGGSMKKEIVCPVCEGKGYVSWINCTETSCGSVSKTCPHCNGTRWVEVDFTNADHIRSMTDEELAEHNVQDSLEYTIDYDWDENPIGEYTPCFKTSDGAIFWSYEDAVEYELHWLKQPYKEET